MEQEIAGIGVEPHARCACCGGEGAILHRDLEDRLFGVPGRWTMRRCARPDCGLAWLDPQPRPDQLGKLYESYYTHDGGDAAAEEEDAGRQFRTIGAKALAKRMLGALMPWRRAAFETDLLHLQSFAPGRLLDVGCGNGGFLAAAARAGWQAHGLDFDEKAVAAARRLPGVEAEVGDLVARHYPDASFDAIVMNNVIEHLPAPTAVFAECRRILAPGGHLVMITPNAASLGHALYGRHWRGLEPPRHLLLFTTRALRRFARAAGFTRILAFTSPGRGMIEASNGLADQAGAPGPRHAPRAVRRQTLLRNLLGRECGEWAVLVATR